VAHPRHVEFEVLRWVDWYNQRRLHGWTGDIPPVEYENTYYAAHNPSPTTVEEERLTLHRTRGGSDSVVAGLGLPDLTRHGLRHTGATWMADAGIPPHVLQDILGHASMETIRGYLHPDDRHLASAAEQANAFLSAAGQRKQARCSGPSARGL